MSHTSIGAPLRASRNAADEVFATQEIPPPSQAPSQGTTTGSSPGPAQAAKALYEAMHGGWLNHGALHIGDVVALGVDAQALFAVLETLAPQDFVEVEDAYATHYQRDLLEDLRAELDTDDHLRAQCLIRGDHAEADARSLRSALRAWPSPDHDAVARRLGNRSPERLLAIEDAYDRLYRTEEGASLRDALTGVFDLDAAIRATPPANDVISLHPQQRSLQDALAIDKALERGWPLGPDANAIVDILQRTPPEERELLGETYRHNVDARGLDLALREGLQGARRDLAVALLRNNADRADAARLRSMVESPQAAFFADKSPIEQVLAGRTVAELDAVRQAYQDLYGTELDSDLRNALGGADRFYAELHLRGAPEDPFEALRRLNDVHQFERTSGLAFIGSRAMDVFNDHGEHFDRNVQQANRLALLARQDGIVTAEEEQSVARFVGYANDDAGTQADARAGLADAAGSAAAVVGSVAVVTLSAGTATPLVLAASAAGTAATARVAVSAAISGNHYAASDLVQDVARGGTEGLVAAAGGTVFRGAAAAAVPNATQGAARMTAVGALEGAM